MQKFTTEYLMMNLDSLAIQYGTDKSSLHHNYMPIYEEYLAPFRGEHIHFIELGGGGSSFDGKMGASAGVWSHYFPIADISILDHDPVCEAISHNRTTVFIGEQDDKELLDSMCEGKPPTVIVDDASHKIPKTIRSFKILFEHLEQGGFYFIEDTHCSYEPKFGNNREEFDRFILELMRAIDTQGRKLTPHNMQDHKKLDYSELSYWERWIESIEYHRGVLVIKKRSE